MEEPSGYAERRNSKEVKEFEKVVCDNILLRLQIKKRQRELGEVLKEIDAARNENDRLHYEALKDDDLLDDNAEVLENDYDEFYEKLSQNLSTMQEKIKEQNSFSTYLKSSFSSLFFLEVVLLFIIGFLLSKSIYSGEKKS